MRRATSLDLTIGNKLIDCENKELTLYQRYNFSLWAAVNVQNNVEFVSIVDITKYRIKD